MSFELSNEDWEIVASELAGIGWPPTDSERKQIELICELFVLARLQGGKSLPKPGEQSKKWNATKTAAMKLHEKLSAIAEDPGAADLNLMIGPEFMPMLVRVIHQTAYVAEVENLGPRVHNKVDPQRDKLASALLEFWTSRGGSLGTSVVSHDAPEGGPLVRFMVFTYGKALECAGMGLPKAGNIRDEVRKYREKVARRGK